MDRQTKSLLYYTQRYDFEIKTNCSCVGNRENDE